MTVTPFRRNNPAWWGQLDFGRTGNPLTHYRNAAVAVRSDPNINLAFAYDEMLRAPILEHEIGAPLDMSRCPRPLTDNDVRTAQEWLQDLGLRGISFDSVQAAIFATALDHSFHPVRQYIDPIIWDGEERAEFLFPRYFGTEENPYTLAISKWFLISLIARAYRPGCKCDYMIVLEGPQGTLKSSALAVLGGPWFSDSLPDLSSKDACQHVSSKWLIEMAEMHALNKHESTLLKSFLTRTEERYRRPFARNESFEPRQNVFAGTTNKDTWLNDGTGNRRYWPVKCGDIRLAWLKHDRDQLFAEAKHLFDNGVQWWPSAEFEREYMLPQQEARYAGDTWEDEMRAFLDGKNGPLYFKDIVCGCLGYEDDNLGLSGNGKLPYKSHFKTAEQRRATTALQAIGWVKHDRQARGTRYRRG